MRRVGVFFSVALVLVLSSAVLPERETKVDLGGDGVEWISFEEAIARSKTEPRKILVDIYTDWCGWCKKMDKESYSKIEISNYLNEKFYAVKFNAEQREEVVFDGHTFKFVARGRRGYHELAAALTNNSLSYPTTVFMDEEQRIIQPVPGYLNAPTLDTILKYIGESEYKSTPWNEFQKNYKSKL
ncbi:MAG: DUF255 domain-containing protein [Cyclobacteriaceae bacterium]|nr:DUF255 domain-containing protein [Cyclobacteriaceae bacterium HetDA_MAG_MS6]